MASIFDGWTRRVEQVINMCWFESTYDLVDAGHLGLEDGYGVTNGWLLVDDGGCSESSLGHVH